MDCRPKPIAVSAVLFLLVLACGLGAQAGGARFALVIGNGNYNELGKLKNPVNDATDMAKALQDLGFKVKLLVNADLASMEDAVVRLGNDLAQKSDSVGFFFYAGHGVQAGGTNYLIPADARIASESFLKNKALPAQSVLDTLQSSRNALNVIVLDACRDNPFSWGRSSMRGLTVSPSQPPGSIVAYSTSAGRIAEDGTGRNGVFTAELLKQIRTPGLEINEVFKRTGKAVSGATAGRQIPAIYNQFFDSAWFAGAPAPQQVAAAAPPPAPAGGFGSVIVKAAAQGELFMDGTSRGILVAGGEATLNKIAEGRHLLEMRYSTGEKEVRAATVQEGTVTAVAFASRSTASAQPVVPPAATQEPAPAAAVNGMVLVAGGTFTMGSEVGEKAERPPHQVTVSDFYLSACEVTQEQYRTITGTNPSHFRGDALPVEGIRWSDAVVYCNRLSIKEGLTPCYTVRGSADPDAWPKVESSDAVNRADCDFKAKGYRLPTEAEWEYAARGGQAQTAKRLAYSGSNEADIVGWYAATAKLKSHPVGQKKPNGLGLYDMSGNVWEWCWDWYGPYRPDDEGNASVDPRGPVSGSERVVRGGSWFDSLNTLRPAYRSHLRPLRPYGWDAANNGGTGGGSENNPDHWNVAYNLGFRVARSAVGNY